MPVASVTFDEVILALHIIFVVVAFGVLAAYPLFMLVGPRLDPAAMPWFHRMQQAISRWLISPGLLLVVIFGVILASEYHAWKAFYVQWGIGAAIVIGAIEGMVVMPRTGRLAEIAARDLGGESAAGRVALGADYRAASRLVLLAASVIGAIVIATVVIMALHVGG